MTMTGNKAFGVACHLGLAYKDIYNQDVVISLSEATIDFRR